MQSLYYMDLAKVEASRREKWICGIQETIAALRQVGITWSDVRADNVLINSTTDEPWLQTSEEAVLRRGLTLKGLGRLMKI